MAANDDRRVIEAKVEPDGSIRPESINTALRQISEMIYKQEGRKGPVDLRDQLRVLADKAPVPMIGTTTAFNNARYEVAFRGTLGEELEITQGIEHRGDAYVATHPNPSGIRFSAGRVTVFGNTGLKVGQFFIPTTLATWP